MGAQIRVYRQKIASTSSMKKIFKAMEMIATSRINKARNAAQAAGPYANALTRMVTAVATQHGIKHPLIHKPHEFGTYEHRRSAILVVTSDRGLAGSYSSAILRRTESLIERLRSNGQEVQLYLVGRKAKAYFEFRERPYARAWEGPTNCPSKRAAWTNCTSCTPSSSRWLFRNPRSCVCCPFMWAMQRKWARKSFPIRN